VVAVGAFGGRLDQQMANLNMAYRYKGFRDFFLLSEHSIAFVLEPGSHVIEPNPEAEDGTCGLIPLGGRCDGVRTTGCVAAPMPIAFHCIHGDPVWGSVAARTLSRTPSDHDIEGAVAHRLPLRRSLSLVPRRSLQWNLYGDRPLEFGSLVSSSNRVVGPMVTVTTSAPLLWTTSLSR